MEFHDYPVLREEATDNINEINNKVDDESNISSSKKTKRLLGLLRDRPPLKTTIKFVTAVTTIYALFGDDIRVSSTSQSADNIFDIFTTISLFIFTIEITAASIGKKGYLWSFFFFLDLLSTASLLLDLTFFAENFFENSGDTGVTRVGRASRAGSRAARVVRMIRLIRLLRIVKLYKVALGRKKEEKKMEILEKNDKKRTSTQSDLSSVEEKGDENFRDESRVGKKLSELTTRKVILLVLAMLFVLPQFEITGHFEEMETSPQPFTKASAVRNIIQTIFICLILGGGALFFSKDANDLVLRPIERMAEKMEKLRIVEPLETVILEKTIIKIGGLLAVGFGEAGAEVISHNIRGGSAAVNPMVAGSRVEAILGFCDIRQFNIATEVLQDDIMIFVNQPYVATSLTDPSVRDCGRELNGVRNGDLSKNSLVA
ncbi:hypothetical protein Pmar_PMAR019150 [Perkinsus marinus ATCC 50983]|uniref:Ion transport domain-containing protein n=1 Tax=Perkinsus marinus (strain ATCC 50983 / TXsc) TaxID=423536 RepID=C5KU02_PERM5|nr:hypothetical protein Pmar_PMAR019150 [Perkinsus marinus ATCC 50983]EER12044.1 hypothetical protein Pmar_PMAR019150 [Perkinsus marinus ATCC 50983]|eukprot:XP_002780249.1 hypothetical protein Pmar_PMAR019150 [Perkinsus marinus ATCC 50983]